MEEEKLAEVMSGKWIINFSFSNFMWLLTTFVLSLKFCPIIIGVYFVGINNIWFQNLWILLPFNKKHTTTACCSCLVLKFQLDTFSMLLLSKIIIVQHTMYDKWLSKYMWSYFICFPQWCTLGNLVIFFNCHFSISSFLPSFFSENFRYVNTSRLHVD